ncbi:MAG: class I SAM-dependent methyltransferase [Thermoplasmatota archaeon]
MSEDKDKVSYKSYQEMAEYYYSQVDKKPYNAYYERPGLISLLPDVEGKKVLDAGCAAGWYTKWLIDNGAEVTAIDFSPNMIEMTKKRVGGKAEVIQADLNEPLNFLDDRSLDIIISSLTLHYLKSWDNVMKEFNRILVNKGLLVFSVHHPFMDYSYFDCDDYFEVRLLTDEWGTSQGDIEVQFYRRPLSEIIRPVIENGFVIENITEPMPTETFKEKQPKAYERLTKEPQFLFLRSRKE